MMKNCLLIWYYITTDQILAGASKTLLTKLSNKLKIFKKIN